ncbi:unnamed protein product [Rotaria magnacalcarata]|uniref:ATPase AAA-type core domain-containing protein n=1 Tax=Rotaria magnacalcarata TaxID=392030 RepID=A0A8S3FLP6_9BILA|nr:unnamed protein product [Rotaria magnacalcarata]
MTMIQCFGLDTNENQQVQNLSGGNKRKLSASLAFMANPTLIFLDEPTTGLDAAAKRKVWNVIRTARDAGLTIIMTSHRNWHYESRSIPMSWQSATSEKPFRQRLCCPSKSINRQIESNQR